MEKEQWRQVTTLTIGATVSGYSLKAATDAKVYVHLFESNEGNRKMSYGVTTTGLDPKKLEDFVKSTDLYHERIYRWLNGRVDPEIPRYEQIPEEETVNMLKGKLS